MQVRLETISTLSQDTDEEFSRLLFISAFLSERSPSPLAGEGQDGGKEIRQIPPTFILPHKEGGGKRAWPPELGTVYWIAIWY